MTKMICGLVLISSLAWAEDAPPATTSEVQAVPSDTIKYPDASQVLNKTEPKVDAKADVKPDAKIAAKSALPVGKLVAAKPVPAASIAAPAATTASTAASAAKTGWFLKWELADETTARAWAASLKRPADVNAAEGHWEVWTGPLGAGDLAILSDQAGKAILVKR